MEQVGSITTDEVEPTPMADSDQAENALSEPQGSGKASRVGEAKIRKQAKPKKVNLDKPMTQDAAKGAAAKALKISKSIRAFSGRSESKRDSHGRADLIHGAGWMEAGMDGQAVVDGSSVASAGCG